MKKRLLLILVAVIALIFCACSNNLGPNTTPTQESNTPTSPTNEVPPTDTGTAVFPTPCNHVFLDADCTKAKTCSICGATEGDALGHSWNDGVITATPTENAEGQCLYTCDICGETKTETLPALDHVHTYKANVTAPTCENGGYTNYTCACGDSYTADKTAPLGHAWQEATCTQAKTCTTCNATEGNTLCHTPVRDNAVGATCTTTGKTEGSHCQICGTILVAQTEIEKIPHYVSGNYCTLCGNLKDGLAYLLDEAPPYNTPYWYKSGESINMGGQTYAHGFSCMGYGDEELGNVTYFDLDAQYEVLTFVAGIIENNSRNKPVAYTIYADGDIIYYFEMASNSLPQEHSVNISGCKQLMISVSDTFSVANGSGTYGLGEIIVAEKGILDAPKPMKEKLENGKKYLLKETEPYSTPHWYNPEGVIKMSNEVYWHGFTCMGYGNEPTGNEIYFDLNGRFTEIAFLTGIVSENQRGKNVTISLYADGALIYSTTMNAGALPTKHAVDITGCKQLMITVYDGYSVANGSGTYGIAEIIVK